MDVSQVLPPPCCCNESPGNMSKCEIFTRTANICCFVLECSHWAVPLILRNNSRPCDETTGENSQGNNCGKMVISFCGQGAELTWVVSDDGTSIEATVTGSVIYNRDWETANPVLETIISFSHTESGLGFDWHEAGFTWDEVETFIDSTGATYTETVTYTIRKCETGDTGIEGGPFDEFLVKFVAKNFGEDETFFVFGEGHRLCGSTSCGRLIDGEYNQSTCTDVVNDTIKHPWQIAWNYNVFTGNVHFLLSCDSGAASFPIFTFSVAYDDGNWVGTDEHEILWEDGDKKLVLVNECDDPYLPPFCEAYACFPECLVKFCIPDVYASILFLEVTSVNGCCLNGSYSFTWNGSSYYSGKIGDMNLVDCGYVEIWYECSGDTFRRRVKTTDVNSTVTENTQDNPGNCVDHPPTGEEFEDTFDLLSGIFSPLCFNVSPFFTDTVTFDIFTNNGGL